LQKFAQDETPVFDGDAGRPQIQRVKIGRTAGGMHHEIGFDRNFLSARPGAQADRARRWDYMRSLGQSAERRRRRCRARRR
jgi:hypothetical protein